MQEDKLIISNEESNNDDRIQNNNSEISSAYDQNYLPPTSMTPNFKTFAQRDLNSVSGEIES